MEQAGFDVSGLIQGCVASNATCHDWEAEYRERVLSEYMGLAYVLTSGLELAAEYDVRGNIKCMDDVLCGLLREQNKVKLCVYRGDEQVKAILVRKGTYETIKSDFTPSGYKVCVYIL